MEPCIRLRSLIKDYGSATTGSIRAVDGIDLDIGPGEIVALLGPNGAGKTTTLDIVLGFTEPTEGEVHVFGGTPRKALADGRVSAVLQTGGLLRDLTVGESVELIASTYRASTSRASTGSAVDPVGDVLERTGLIGRADRLVKSCSGGEQQRLRFALALLADPDLLLLDEPTAGMDVEARRSFWAAMEAEADQGRTIVFATHYLQEAEDFARRTVLLTGGRIVADGPTDQVRRQASDVWFFPLLVLVVGGASVLIRVVEAHQFDQAHLRTRLAISDERSRVARDVHDVLGHSLTAVILKVELCQRLLDSVEPSEPTDRERVEACRRQLAELDSIGRSALAEIRSTVGGLRATNLADEVTVARTVLADAGVDLLVTDAGADVPDVHRSMLAWVVRESVTNIVRHARAEHCHIELGPGPGPILLRVTDDGVGLGSRGEGNGLRGLRERVASAGGVLRIEAGHAGTEAGTGPAGGTRIEVVVV